MTGALEGIRILELSEIIAAPFGGMLLADLGAEVIKVEPPEGESWRLNGQFTAGESRGYISLNRNKRGVALDLKTPEGQAVVHRLAASCDVVIVNFKPATQEKLRVDYDTLRAQNPTLIYVENTALGRRGPESHRSGYDIVAQAATGLMATGGRRRPDGLPAPMSPPVADYATGLAIAWSTCAALFHRERTGEGQKVETTLLASALAMQGHSVLDVEKAPRRELQERLAQARARGAEPEELDAIAAEARLAAADTNAYYRCYRTADGVIAVACLNPALRRRMADALEVEDPRHHDPDLPRSGPDAAEIARAFVQVCEERMRERSTAEWLARLDEYGVPAAPYRYAIELLDDEQVAANELIAEFDHPVAGAVRMIGPLVRMHGSPTAMRAPSPTLGQHSDEVLAQAGYSAAEIAELREHGILA